MEVILDEYDMRALPPRQRLDKIEEQLKTQDDESVRWDAVWLAGEMCDTIPKNNPMRREIANLMAWILAHEKNGIVKHEAAFQIGLRNFRDKIPDLIECAKNDQSEVARHEAIEALGLMRDHGSKKELEKLAKSKSMAVSETAIFVLKRLERLKNKGKYKDGEPI